MPLWLTRSWLMPALLCSCGQAARPGEPPPAACADLARAEASAELGTGAVTFETLRDGDGLPVVWGGQGGIHVWGSVKVTGIHPGPRGAEVDAASPSVEFLVEAEGRRLNFDNSGPRNLRVRKDGTVELVGQAVILASPLTSIGQAVTFSVEVEDACGTSVGDARDLTIVDPSSELSRP